ncbi:hypothetical protein [Neobacillus vireti]|uniref:hypothetical protein n=1 Tax=Neobacillus vireti TaxID=220686 RepID=UPI002FFF14B8
MGFFDITHMDDFSRVGNEKCYYFNIFRNFSGKVKKFGEVFDIYLLGMQRMMTVAAILVLV